MHSIRPQSAPLRIALYGIAAARWRGRVLATCCCCWEPWRLALARTQADRTGPLGFGSAWLPCSASQSQKSHLANNPARLSVSEQAHVAPTPTCFPLPRNGARRARCVIDYKRPAIFKFGATDDARAQKSWHPPHLTPCPALPCPTPTLRYRRPSSSFITSAVWPNVVLRDDRPFTTRDPVQRARQPECRTPRCRLYCSMQSPALLPTVRRRTVWSKACPRLVFQRRGSMLVLSTRFREGNVTSRTTFFASSCLAVDAG